MEAAAAPERKTILVVDDTPDNLSLMAGLLKDEYRVKLANNGEKALAAARADNPPDLILLDVMMPGMSGHEVCQHLKADEKTRNIPVIFLTAMSGVEDEQKGLELGAADYIAKPMSPPIVMARVRSQMLLREAQRALEKRNAQLGQQVQSTGMALGEAQAKLAHLVETGISLGRESNRQTLQRRALSGAREIANCLAVTMFVRTPRNTLKIVARTNEDTPLPDFELPLYDAQGEPIHKYVATHVTLSGESVIIDDVYQETRFDLSGTKKFSEQSGVRTISMLTVPMKPREGEVIGLIQLINALDPKTGEVIPFKPELVNFIEALAAQAGVAIENQNLLDAQKALMDSMIQILAGAIDAKSAYTGGHCARVPELALMLARAACEVGEGPLAGFRFTTEEQWREFRIGAWLHDCGKVTTPEYVVDKATKLVTLVNRIHEIRTRFEVLLRDAQIERLQAVHERGEDAQAAQQRFEQRRAQLLEDFAFVAHCNLGGESMDPGDLQRLRSIAAQPWQRHFDDRLGLSHEELARHGQTPAPALPAAETLLADKPHHRVARPADRVPEARHGFKLEVPELLYNHGELYNLSIARGTLTPEERFKINEHIVQTIVMLEQMPLPSDLQRVPEYAGTHHETLEGTGYPRGLKGDELSVPARIMAIADIFEALTASDRPYKRASTLSQAVAKLSEFAQRGHVDPLLFRLFLSSGVYRSYAELFLEPDQIDEVDVAAYLSA